jgi:hypothetical protein
MPISFIRRPDRPGVTPIIPITAGILTGYCYRIITDWPPSSVAEAHALQALPQRRPLWLAGCAGVWSYFTARPLRHGLDSEKAVGTAFFIFIQET